MNSLIFRIVKHPLTQPEEDIFDVVLLRLKSKIDFTKLSHIRPICLPSGSSSTIDKYSNNFATLTGMVQSANTGHHQLVSVSRLGPAWCGDSIWDQYPKANTTEDFPSEVLKGH